VLFQHTEALKAFLSELKGGCAMKAAIIFSGTGPILLLTSYDSITNPQLVKKLSLKGIKKFVAFEIAEDELKEKYGTHYTSVMDDLKQNDDLRVLDYDGHHILNKFSVKKMTKPIYYEP
jgi:hypothetical protein